MTVHPDGPRPLRRTDGGPVRILVVDDEGPVTELLSMALQHERWKVRAARDGHSALAALREFEPDAAVLDMMLPDVGGLDLLRRIRRHRPDIPVVFLTARGAVEDRVTGLTAGADDYLTKPFSLEELVVRLRGVLRRAGVTAARPAATLVVGDLVLNEDTHDVHRGAERIELTATEFEVLRCLMRAPERVLSKAEIHRRVWGHHPGSRSNIVELYVFYLRRKLDTGSRSVIRTVRGVGYVLLSDGVR